MRAKLQSEATRMSWIVPLAFTVVLALVTYLIWRKVVPDCHPCHDPLMPLMLGTGSSVVWGLFGLYHLNNWYWGIAA
jgi:hypothetical protein